VASDSIGRLFERTWLAWRRRRLRVEKGEPVGPVEDLPLGDLLRKAEEGRLSAEEAELLPLMLAAAREGGSPDLEQVGRWGRGEAPVVAGPDAEVVDLDEGRKRKRRRRRRDELDERLDAAEDEPESETEGEADRWRKLDEAMGLSRRAGAHAPAPARAPGAEPRSLTWQDGAGSYTPDRRDGRTLGPNDGLRRRS
jgi:hypothetical protein